MELTESLDLPISHKSEQGQAVRNHFIPAKIHVQNRRGRVRMKSRKISSRNIRPRPMRPAREHAVAHDEYRRYRVETIFLNTF